MFPCPFCESSLCTPEQFNAHIKLNHRTRNRETCYCKYEQCLRGFNNVYAYKNHIISVHINSHEDDTNLSTPPNSQIEECCSNDFSTNYDKQLDVTKVITTVRSDTLSLQEFAKIVENGASTLIAKLYANNKLPRSSVHDVLENVQKFYSHTCIEILKQTFISNGGSHTISSIEMLELIQVAFDNLKSEHMCQKYFESCGYFIKPQSISVDSYLRSQRSHGNKVVAATNSTIEVIPIDTVLCRFLELPGVYNSIMSHVQYCKESTRIISPIQAELWRDMELKYPGKVILPLILYYDDFEINNPLGAHRGIHQVGAVYFSIPCIPPVYYSLLENIFVAQLHNTRDYNRLSNKQIFGNIIKQMTVLQNDGITITISGEKKTLYFVLISIVGDNKAIHSICGFSPSFNMSHICRFCRADKLITHKQIIENPKTLRNIVNYSKDSKDHTNGVVEECVFNEIPNFHITKNTSVDYMHDLYEGVCRYEIAKILNRFMNIDRLFTLEALNCRIEHFDHGSKNVPPKILMSSLKKELLIISASEMATLVENLNFYIGDFVPIKNKEWKLYLSLREIVCIVSNASYSIEILDKLENLILQHNSIYLKLFKEDLKPKFHYLIHYPRIMKLLGPLKFYSSMRFEAKHKNLKETAKVTTSRRNPCHTIAIKYQYQLCYRLLSRHGFPSRFMAGSMIAEKLELLQGYAEFKNIVRIDIIDNALCVSWVEINGTTYRNGMYLSIRSTDNNITFNKIEHVLVVNADTIAFLCLEVNIITFSQHLQSFEINDTDRWTYVVQKELSDFSSLQKHMMSNGKYYIPLVL